MGVGILLDGPCEMSGHIKLPGFPPTLVAVRSDGGKNDVLDQPEDNPLEDEELHLYAFAGVCFVDYRDPKRRRLSGRYGMYHVVPEGTHQCLDCPGSISSPPPWPFERCTHWPSGFHRIEVETPSLMQVDA